MLTRFAAFHRMRTTILLVLLAGWGMHVSAQDLAPIRSLPSYPGKKVPDEQPTDASPIFWAEEGQKIPQYRSIREFPWRDCFYFSGPVHVEVREGSNEFENPESYYFFVDKVLYLDIDKDGTEEAILKTTTGKAVTTYSNVGVYALDWEYPHLVYLVGIIPGAVGAEESAGHIKSISIHNGFVVVERYERNVKDPESSFPAASHYWVEHWFWDGQAMVQDLSKRRLKEIPERRSWPEYTQWCLKHGPGDCVRWLPKERRPHQR